MLEGLSEERERGSEIGGVRKWSERCWSERDGRE